MLVEIKRNKYFWIALILLLLVPFVVYWIRDGYTSAMRNLTIAVAILLYGLIQWQIFLRRHHQSNNDTRDRSYSPLDAFKKSHRSTVKKIGVELLSDYNVQRKREESAIVKIKKWLLG